MMRDIVSAVAESLHKKREEVEPVVTDIFNQFIRTVQNHLKEKSYDVSRPMREANK